MGRTRDLSGRRVLIVEDEYYIADDVRRMLDAAGAEVIGPCANFDQAKAAVEENGFDCAILDLNLHGRSAEGIADRLIARGKSFAIATGYGKQRRPRAAAARAADRKTLRPAGTSSNCSADLLRGNKPILGLK